MRQENHFFCERIALLEADHVERKGREVWLRGQVTLLAAERSGWVAGLVDWVGN